MSALPTESPPRPSAAVSANGRWVGRVAITGMGLVTPVGLDVAASAAAMRARVSRIADLPGVEIPGPDGEPAPVSGARVPQLPGNREGPARLLRLARPALREALDAACLPANARRAIFVGTSASHAAGHVLDHGRQLAQGFSADWVGPAGAAAVQLVPAGRAASLLAVRAGAAALERGDADVVVVGGVDSWTGPRALLHLRDTGRLRGGDKSAGVLPGEAAGFLVMERPDAASRRGAKVHALVTAAAGETELTPFGEPSRAAALAHVFQAIPVTLADADARSVLIISDLNGERTRAFEWMFASIRAGWIHSDTPHWRPAQAIGDAGAAAGVAGVVWAVTALTRGYAHTRNAVVWGASDEGAREAVMLTPPG
jgi:3-oxoacyl-[acyl-carrier-protein] synthase-1